MADTIQHFYPRLAELNQIKRVISDEFGETGSAIIEAMAADERLGSNEDNIEDLLLRTICEHAVVIAEFEATGEIHNNPSLSMNYLKMHHPEAMALIDKLGGAPGFERSDFIIQVLRYEFLHIVTAEEFDDALFDSEGDALDFARSNYILFMMSDS